MKFWLAAVLALLSLLPAVVVTADDAPAPTLDLLASVVDVSELSGNVAYVDFWASWCPPCKKSFPWMTTMHEKLAERGLVILAVDVDRDPESAKKFLESQNPPFRIVNDPKGELAEAFGVRAMPTAFLFDRSGKWVRTHEGFRNADADALEAALLELLEADSR